MFSHPAWKAFIFVLISIGWASHAFAGVYFIHADHLGTPRVVSDQTGTVVWKADYDTFGKATLTTNVYALNLRFPGQYFDAETNLHYNYFRDYDPAVGRYLQSDPIGIEGGINTYAYALNNPVRYTDRYGLIPCTCRSIGGGNRQDERSRKNPDGGSDEKICTYKCTCTCDSGKIFTVTVKDSAGFSDNAVCVGQTGGDMFSPGVTFEPFGFETGGVRGAINRYVAPFGPSGEMMDHLENQCVGCAK